MKILSALVSLFFILAACEGEKEKHRTERVQVKGVTVTHVTTGTVKGYYETSGTVKADTVSMLSSKVMGRVTSVKVKDGDRVKKGQVLMTIDDADIAAKVRAAEAAYQGALSGLKMAEENFRLAESTYERFKKLYEEKALTEQEMNEIETKKNVASLRLRQAEAMREQARAARIEARAFLDYTRITSPVNGIVSERKIDLGTMAAPGMHLMTIEDPSSHVIDVGVDERLFTSITKGMEADITIDSLGLSTKGTVREISQAIDPFSRTFLVKLSVKNKELRSGFFANVRIPEGEREAIMVPSTAVVKRGQLRGVFVVDDDRTVRYRLVKTGDEREGLVEVLSGLTGSERVISQGTFLAKDGGIVADHEMSAQETAQ